MSTLSIKAKGTGPSSLDESQHRYEDILEKYTTMRQEYNKEISCMRESQRFRFTG